MLDTQGTMEPGRLLLGKHNFVFLGEAGCGKSEIAANLAVLLAKQNDRPVHLFDLDMTKPLFRTRDAADVLTRQGVTVHFEEQFMDAPTAVGGVHRLLSDPNCFTILDVGGDYIGARAIGAYRAQLNRESTRVCYVINPYRPWSATLEHIDKVLGETLGVSHIQLENILLVGNPNLGPKTTAEDVLRGRELLLELVVPYMPVDVYCVRESLYEQVRPAFGATLFPLHLYQTYPWEQEGPPGPGLDIPLT